MDELDREDVTRRLSDAGCIAPGEEADELIRASGDRADVLADLLARRTEGEPLAWLTGAVTFCGVEVGIAPGVYVPRPHTEPLTMRAASLLGPGGVAVDLCTGSGAVAVALSTMVPDATVLATELDPTAARCARHNGVEVFEGFLDDPLPRTFERRVDVLTAVVPYVPTDALRLLPRDVQAYEPELALDGGPDGTALLARVARRSVRWLRPGGWVLLELGGDQAGAIGALLQGCGLERVEVMTDEDGSPRAICARLP
jgi:release factor glutamine methyltransferase